MKQCNISWTFFAFAMFISVFLRPAPASACGVFFCSIQPVDQRAERIIFSVQENTVTAYVLISYMGRPEDFSWILPIPSVPVRLDIFPQLSITALDQATGPVFYPPPDPCEEAETSEGSADTDDGGVTIHDRQDVGPFETVTISSDDPNALITWLETNNYRVTEPMKPVIAVYVEAKMLFLAMKLQPDKDTRDIQPIVIEYLSEKPMIPLRLTAVAAEPEMSFIVWILGSGQFESENYAKITISDSELFFDPRSFQDNYFPTVSQKVDEAGGQAFLTEFAQSTQIVISDVEQFGFPDTEEGRQAKSALLNLLSAYPFITRFYTRMSPEEMTLDPVFRLNEALTDVSRYHDLKMPDDYTCEGETQQEKEARLCRLVYCGPTSSCALTESGGAGCECKDPFVARGFFDPRDQLVVTCQDATLNFMSPEEMEGSGGSFTNPCDDFSCGEGGECVPLNGVATCRCDVGYAGIPRIKNDAASVSCSKIAEEPESGSSSSAYSDHAESTLATSTDTGGESSEETGGESSDETEQSLQTKEKGCGCTLSKDPSIVNVQNITFLGILILLGMRLARKKMTD